MKNWELLVFLPLLAMLMMLALLVDQTQQRCCALFQAVWAKLGSKRRLWERLRALFYDYALGSMRPLLEALLDGLKKPNPIFAVASLAQAGFYSCALAGWFLLKRGRDAGRIFTIPLYVTVSSLGAFLGVVDAIKGRRFDVWESPALSRGDGHVTLGPAGA